MGKTWIRTGQDQDKMTRQGRRGWVQGQGGPGPGQHDEDSKDRNGDGDKDDREDQDQDQDDAHCAPSGVGFSAI